MTGKQQIKLSVTELVEFSARSGNLYDFIEGPTSVEGIRGHQKVQATRGPGWQKEVAVSWNGHLQGFSVQLQGRIDLVKCDLAGTTIEEIKTTYVAPKKIPSAKKMLQQAQAKVYAALYCQQHDINSDDVYIRLTWFDVITQKIYTEEEKHTAALLTTFTETLLQRYLAWHAEVMAQALACRASAKNLSFPFPYFRPGQRAFSAAVYHAISQRQQCLFEAPTGTGKTISTLFPAVKALGENKAKQLVYLSAKGSTQALAQTTLEAFIANGLNITFVVIQAKDKSCPCKSSATADNCRNDEGLCTRSVGFFDRLPEARYACLREKHLSPERLQSIAGDHHLCPHELSVQMAAYMSLIIADMNYVFDPLVRLSVFNTHRQQRVLLIDELHNLVDRGRDMYSAELSARATRKLTRLRPRLGKTAVTALDKLAHCLEQLADGPSVMPQIPDAVLQHLGESLTALAAESSQHGQNVFAHDQDPALSQWLRAALRFHTIAELFGEAHVVLVEAQPGDHADSVITLFCRDAARFLEQHHKSARSSIGFSATLRPMAYYHRATGYSANCQHYALPGFFPAENQLTLHCAYIDTRYAQRRQSTDHLVELIHTTFVHSQGNCLVFFPSYQYLDDVLTIFSQRHPKLGAAIVRQSRDTDESARQQFLAHFFKPTQAHLGFAIVGGVYGEGIDYAGEALKAAIIIGAGMPQPTARHRSMADFYTRHGHNGYHYTYQFPGFTRVQQSAGRVIRSEHDRGVVILVDPRFSRPEYRALMPAHWQLIHCGKASETEHHLRHFWHSDPASISTEHCEE